MFCKVLVDNPDIARQLAELITGKKIARIGMPSEQKPVKVFADGKGVRFDDKGACPLCHLSFTNSSKSGIIKRT